MFVNMPVRLQELNKNLKKEYARLQSLVQAYAVIATGVKVKCINVNEKG